MCRSDSTREATVPPDISPGIPTVPGTVEAIELDYARAAPRRALGTDRRVHTHERTKHS